MEINILHLSDIQYGRHHVDRGKKRKPIYKKWDYDDQLEKIKESLDNLAKKHGVRPNFIAVTGDIAEESKPEEYELAESFIGGIANHLEIDRRYVVMVPGNHDVSWNLCRKARKKAEREGREFNPPYFPKFGNYRKFFNRFYEKAKFPPKVSPYKFSNKLFVNYCFSEEVVFCGLNSCVDESDKPPHSGRITLEQFKRAISEIEDIDPNRKLFRVVMMHHNYQRDSYNDNENLIDKDELQPLLISHNIHLILHGHQHKPFFDPNAKPFILATGSAGLDSETIPEISRRYQVVQINRKYIRVYPFRFDDVEIGLNGKGAWVPVEASENYHIRNFYKHKISKSIKEVFKNYKDNSHLNIFTYFSNHYDCLMHDFFLEELSEDTTGEFICHVSFEEIMANEEICALLEKIQEIQDENQKFFEDLILRLISLHLFRYLDTTLEWDARHRDVIEENIIERWFIDASFSPTERTPRDSLKRFVDGVLYEYFLEQLENKNLIIVFTSFEQLVFNDKLSNIELNASSIINCLNDSLRNSSRFTRKGVLPFDLKFIIFCKSKTFPKNLIKDRSCVNLRIQGADHD